MYDMSALKGRSFVQEMWPSTPSPQMMQCMWPRKAWLWQNGQIRTDDKFVEPSETLRSLGRMRSTDTLGKVLFTSGSTGMPKVIRASHTAAESWVRRFIPSESLTCVSSKTVCNIEQLSSRKRARFKRKNFVCIWFLHINPVETVVESRRNPFFEVMTHLLHVVRHHQLQATDVDTLVHMNDTCTAWCFEI